MSFPKKKNTQTFYHRIHDPSPEKSFSPDFKFSDLTGKLFCDLIFNGQKRYADITNKCWRLLPPTKLVRPIPYRFPTNRILFIIHICVQFLFEKFCASKLLIDNFVGNSSSDQCVCH